MCAALRPETGEGQLGDRENAGKGVLTATTDHNDLRCSHDVICRGKYGEERRRKRKKRILKKGFGAGQKPTVYRPRYERMEDVGR